MTNIMCISQSLVFSIFFFFYVQIKNKIKKTEVGLCRWCLFWVWALYFISLDIQTNEKMHYAHSHLNCQYSHFSFCLTKKSQHKPYGCGGSVMYCPMWMCYNSFVTSRGSALRRHSQTSVRFWRLQLPTQHTRSASFRVRGSPPEKKGLLFSWQKNITNKKYEPCGLTHSVFLDFFHKT